MFSAKVVTIYKPFTLPHKVKVLHFHNIQKFLQVNHYSTFLQLGVNAMSEIIEHVRVHPSHSAKVRVVFHEFEMANGSAKNLRAS